MSRQSPTSAYLVARQGEVGRPVIAPDWWAALGQVLAEEGALDLVRQVTARVAASGVVVRCDDQVWTVRRHVPSSMVVPADLAGLTDLRAASDRALEAALSVAPAESAGVLLLERGFLRFVAVRGPHASSLLGVRLPSTSGIAGYVLQTQRPLVVGDAARHPRHDGALDAITGYETRQILAVPLTDGGVVQGVLELMNPPDGARFGSEQRRGVEEVARVLAGYLAQRGGTSR